MALSACQQNAVQQTTTSATGQKQDVKQLAASLQAKTVAAIDAINSKNDANIQRAKTELQREADRVEEALKSETGAGANRVNAAVGRIRTALLNNDVTLLQQARDLLQQAQQQ